MLKTKKCIALDKLVSEGWFSKETEAIPWVLARKVLVNNQPISSVKEQIPVDGTIRIKEYYKKRYVNKGGLKLEGALADFNLDVQNKVALDCGASTGGFTDCLIEHGAQLVYAVDVGYGQLAGKLLINDKVINLERTNIADKCLMDLSPTPSIITLDLSYLSLKEAIPICKNILKSGGTIVSLIKSIFEVDSVEIRRNGKINDYDLLKSILNDLCVYFLQSDLNIIGITNSPVRGNNDTLEYFICLSFGNQEVENINSSYHSQIDEALNRSFTLEKFNKNNFNKGSRI